MKYKNFTSTPRYSNAEKMYYGGIEEIPEAKTLEAPTIEDFERAFHDAVDDYIISKKGITANNKKRLNFIFPLILLGLVVAMALSCPKKEQHRDSLTDKLSSVILEDADSDIAIVSHMLGNPISKFIVDTYVTVDDYFLCSIGKFDHNGKTSIVSVGILGHVFTLPKSTLKRQMEQNPRMQELIWK